MQRVCGSDESAEQSLGMSTKQLEVLISKIQAEPKLAALSGRPNELRSKIVALLNTLAEGHDYYDARQMFAVSLEWLDEALEILQKILPPINVSSLKLLHLQKNLYLNEWKLFGNTISKLLQFQ